MPSNSFGTKDQLVVDNTTYTIHRLDRIKTAHRLPYSLKVLLKNLLGVRVVIADRTSAFTIST